LPVADGRRSVLGVRRSPGFSFEGLLPLVGRRWPKAG
jgi:hypothetical protein